MNTYKNVMKMIECNITSPDPCPQVMYIIHENKNEIFNNNDI